MAQTYNTSLIVLAAVAVTTLATPPLAAAATTTASTAVSTVASTAGASTPAPEGPHVLTYNVCGGSCHKELSQDEWNGRIRSLIDAAGADVILFQELCHGQYLALQEALGDGYDSRWAGTMSDNQGCGRHWGQGVDGGYGDAIFIRGAHAIRASHTVPLPNAMNHEPRALLCVDARLAGGKARVCDTHLDYHAETERAQAAYVADLLARWAARMPVVFGGDLNATPGSPQLDGFYGTTAATGHFLEADETDAEYFDDACAATARRCRSGEHTEEGRKVDYIFFSGRHFRAPTGQAANRDPLLSDHRPLVGAAAWRGTHERAAAGTKRAPLRSAARTS
jgi:endonuclease/exonuclease/phosphatase family metal-dependent hydrolase